MRHPLLPRLPLQIRRQLAARPFSSSAVPCRAFQEGDVVLIRDKKRFDDAGSLVKLRQDKTQQSHRGTIQHADIIGKQPRQLVQSSKGTDFRLFEPTLAEYVRLTPRLVTPIYPQDANLIVSLLDIHVDTFSPAEENAPPLEILEAGTGHGSLTLHLSRAIHAANPPFPTNPFSHRSADGPEDAVYGGESISDLQESSLELWRTGRRAILHTLDIKSTYSKAAKKIVQGFRRGMYARNVDFHVGDVSAWIASQRVLRKTEEPFLAHVFLDLPNADSHIANVASALRVNGLLGIFNPSITQIVECVETIRKHKLPFILDQVVELSSSNGRQWDVRSVKPRATLKEAERGPERSKEDESQSPPGSAAEAIADAIEGQEARDSELAEELAKQQEKWATVCRPKVGEMVVGGGFIGLWRRMEPAMEAQPKEAADA